MLRLLFFAFIVRPFLFLWVGLHVRGHKNLPQKGPALIAANHNSHMDTLALMALFPLKQLRHVQAVAAADYFLGSRVLRFIALQLIGILPIERQRKKMSKSHPIDAMCAGLDEGKILILFPEGTRGEPERLSAFKAGLAHLAERRPEVKITPVFLHGFGKVLPKGSFLPVPFFCDIAIGQALPLFETQEKTMKALQNALQKLSEQT